MTHKPPAGLYLSAVALGALMFASPALAADAPAACTPPPALTLVVNVKDKGAKGDGQTDDTAAIQAAIDAIGDPRARCWCPRAFT
jgi:Pectate lyase superfamily protein